MNKDMSAKGGSASGGKNRILIALALVLGLGVSLVGVSTAFAAALTYSFDTKISFSADTTKDFVIKSGSTATSLIVDTSHVHVVVPASGTFTVISSNRTIADAGNSLGTVTTTCNTSNMEQVVIVAGSSQSEDITLTPGTSHCDGGSGGGGGGGGGGGTPATPATPATPETPATPATSAAPAAGTHSNGTLVNDNGTFYLIKDGQKIGFRDAKEYASYGYNFGQAVSASASDKALPSTSAVAKAMEGTLVLDSADGKTVYMIGTGSTKRGFVSANVFKALGYSFANLPKINLADYPVGPAIGTATEVHPDGSLVKEGQTIWWIRGNVKQGFESMAVFNTYGFSLSRVVTSNAADNVLAQGSIVKFRDGTLVNDGGTYYLITDGLKKAFSSTSDLTSKGYKTANAINAALAAYTSGGLVQ